MRRAVTAVLLRAVSSVSDSAVRFWCWKETVTVPSSTLRQVRPVLPAEPPQISARGSWSARKRGRVCDGQMKRRREAEGPGTRGARLAWGHLIPGPRWLGFHSGGLVGFEKPWVRTVRAGSETLRDYGNGIIRLRADGSPEGLCLRPWRVGAARKCPEMGNRRPALPPRMWHLCPDRPRDLEKLTEESSPTERARLWASGRATT